MTREDVEGPAGDGEDRGCRQAGHPADLRRCPYTSESRQPRNPCLASLSMRRHQSAQRLLTRTMLAAPISAILRCDTPIINPLIPLPTPIHPKPCPDSV